MMMLKREGLWWVDENGNRWSRKRKPRPEELLVNCTDCTNCTNCYGCKDCERCIQVYSCKGLYSFMKVRGLYGNHNPNLR